MYVNSDFQEEDHDNGTSTTSSAFRPLPPLPVAEPESVPKRRVPLPPSFPEPRSRDNGVNGESGRSRCGENAIFEDERKIDASSNGSSCNSGREELHSQKSTEAADFRTHKEPPMMRSKSVPGAYRPAKWPPHGLIQITDEILAKVALKKTGVKLPSENHEVPAASKVRQNDSQSEPIVDVEQADPPATLNGNTDNDLRNNPWFFESLNRTDSEDMLLRVGTDGTFVVRPCQHADRLNSPYVLTVLRRSAVYHMTIRLVPNGKYALGSEKSCAAVFNSVAELISFYHNNSLLIKTSHKSTAVSDEVLLTGSPRKL